VSGELREKRGRTKQNTEPVEERSGTFGGDERDSQLNEATKRKHQGGGTNGCRKEFGGRG